MPRLFTGFFLPKEVRDDATIPADTTVRLVPAHFLHCTLLFVGSVPTWKVLGIHEALEKVRFDPFESRLTGGGIFGIPPGRLVLWASLEPATPVIELRTAIGAAMNQPIPDGPFTPHVTLGRSIRGADLDRDAWLQYLGRLNSQPFLVSSFELVRSDTRPEGAHYESIGQYKAR